MLKKRLIGSLTIDNGIVVQTSQFETIHPIGRVDIAVRYLQDWGIDEICIVDVSARESQKKQNIDLLKKIVEVARVPLSFGGNINTSSQAKEMIRLGFEKIIISSALFSNQKITEEIARFSGEQSVIVCLDYIKKNSEYICTSNRGRKEEEPLLKSIQKINELEIGEVILRNIQRDGTQQGYDLESVEKFAGEIKRPVIVAGGSGPIDNIIAALSSTHISAVTLGNSLHFFEQSAAVFRSQVQSSEIELRPIKKPVYEEIGRLKQIKPGREQV